MVLTFWILQQRTVDEKPFSADFVDDSSLDLPLVNHQASTLSLPKQLSFAGEEVPLHIPEVIERLDREMHINAYWHTNTIFLIKRANRWLPLIEPILAQHGIPEDFKYLAVIESSLENVTSPRNAVGFWQLLKPTANELGLETNRWIDERYDPIRSTEAACRYLKKAYDRLGNWTLVAAAYNRGVRGIQNALENQQVDNYYDLLLNEETARYVYRILACKEILENPSRYGFKVDKTHLYETINYTYVRVSNDINDLVAFAKAQGITYKQLRMHNPWLQDSKLKVGRGKTYLIAIPGLKPAEKQPGESSIGG